MTQTRPNIGAAATDEQDNILTYRHYSLQGHETQATHEMTFTPIEQPGVRRKERRQVLTASSPESTDPSLPAAWQSSSQSTPMIMPTRAKRRLSPLAKSPTWRVATAATNDNPFPEQASMILSGR